MPIFTRNIIIGSINAMMNKKEVLSKIETIRKLLKEIKDAEFKNKVNDSLDHLAYYVETRFYSKPTVVEMGEGDDRSRCKAGSDDASNPGERCPGNLRILPPI